MKEIDLKGFYKNKKVLITGNTGFKGSWMSLALVHLGAEVVGLALEPITSPNLFSILKLDKTIKTYYSDIRELGDVLNIFEKEAPEIVIHMAAQPLVIESYKNPVHTYGVNVMGTVNVCEAVRLGTSIKSFINVTTDKVYRNNEWVYPYREVDALDGYDPYSNSKSCSELVTASYIRSFLDEKRVAVSTCRAGNVIGGGDYSDNRIIPDCVRASTIGEKIKVRNPYSIRPYQHVLEAVDFYLRLAALQYKDRSVAGNYNIGPCDDDCLTTSRLCDIFCASWGEGAAWESINQNGHHEANYLKLDTSKARDTLGWRPRWRADEAVANTVKWYKAYCQKEDMVDFTKKQILEFGGM